MADVENNQNGGHLGILADLYCDCRADPDTL